MFRARHPAARITSPVKTINPKIDNQTGGGSASTRKSDSSPGSALSGGGVG